MVAVFDTALSPRVENDSIKQETSGSTHSGNNYNSRNAGWRSRGWTPLKYPKSSVFPGNQGSDQHSRVVGKANVYFPLHQDVLLASVRELLILDGTLHGNTLKVSESTAKFHQSGVKSGTVLIPKYLQHLDPAQWSALKAADVASKKSSNQNKGVLADSKSKRKRQKLSTESGNNRVKRSKREEGVPDLVHDVMTSDDSIGERDAALSVKHHERNDNKLLHHPSAEEIAHAILLRARIVVFDNPRPLSKTGGTIGESTLESANSSPTQLHDTAEDGAPPVEEGDLSDISHFLSLPERSPDGSIRIRVSPNVMPNMVQTSISSEAILRDAAMAMTTRLVESFSDTSLRLFLGYKKTPAVVGRDRLIRLLAAFLFDASHAMFAWDQTEEEVLSRLGKHADADRDIDSIIQKSLFDERALRKIGGFEPSSLLPHAISIARLRRRCLNDNKKANLNSWEFFATTAQGNRMLSHHRVLGGCAAAGVKSSSSVISVGKQRRGQRLRQRHWLTSSLLWNESSECDASLSSSSSCQGGARSRTSSIASYEEASGPGAPPQPQPPSGDSVLLGPTRNQARILTEMPGTMAVSLAKDAIGSSWGVLLAKEGDMCVVARASPKTNQKDAVEADQDQQLRCGDLILHAQNERAEEASTPLCVSANGNLFEFQEGQFREDWFRAMVELFKGSQELHLIIQRVGTATN